MNATLQRHHIFCSMQHWSAGRTLLSPGGHASDTDDITADGQDGISFVNPIGEIFLHPLAGTIWFLFLFLFFLVFPSSSLFPLFSSLFSCLCFLFISLNLFHAAGQIFSCGHFFKYFHSALGPFFSQSLNQERHQSSGSTAHPQSPTFPGQFTSRPLCLLKEPNIFFPTDPHQASDMSTLCWTICSPAEKERSCRYLLGFVLLFFLPYWNKTGKTELSPPVVSDSLFSHGESWWGGGSDLS